MPKTIVNGKLTNKHKNAKSSKQHSDKNNQKNNIKLQAKPFFIDATNLCYWKDTSAPTINVLLELLIALRENGKKTFYCIFDANTQYKIPEYERKVYKSLLEHKNFFYQVTGGKRADDFILELADAYQAPVISNDNYNDPKYSKYKWKDRDFLPQRLFMGEVIPVLGNHHLIISELNVHKTLSRTTKELYEELLQLIYPKINRQQGQIKFFNSHEGWGRIRYEVDIYFHKSSFNKEREVEEGLDVEFTLQENEKGVYADDIAIIVEEDLDYFSGILESYDEQKSRGIVKIDNRKERLFFYKSYFEDPALINKVTKGQRVEFTIGNNKNGRCAKNIRLLTPDWEVKVEKLEETLTQVKAMVKAKDKTIEQYKKRLSELAQEKTNDAATEDKRERSREENNKHKSSKKQYKQKSDNKTLIAKQESSKQTVKPEQSKQRTDNKSTSSNAMNNSKQGSKKVDIRKPKAKNIPPSQQLDEESVVTPKVDLTKSSNKKLIIPPSQQLEKVSSASEGKKASIPSSQQIEKTDLVEQTTTHPIIPPSQQIAEEKKSPSKKPAIPPSQQIVEPVAEGKTDQQISEQATKINRLKVEAKPAKKWTIINTTPVKQDQEKKGVEKNGVTVKPESVATDNSSATAPQVIESPFSTKQEDDQQGEINKQPVRKPVSQKTSESENQPARKPAGQKTKQPVSQKTKQSASQKTKRSGKAKTTQASTGKHLTWWGNLEEQWQKAFNVVLNRGEVTDCPEDAVADKLFKIKKLSFFRTSRNKLSFKLTSVSGLQYLTNLTQLNISQHQIPSVQDLAKLEKLVFLNCSGNQLTNLKGVKELPVLRDFNCSKNQLTFAQLENITDTLPKLEKLDCRNNKLTKAEKEQVSQWALKDIKV